MFDQGHRQDRGRRQLKSGDHLAGEAFLEVPQLNLEEVLVQQKDEFVHLLQVSEEALEGATVVHQLAVPTEVEEVHLPVIVMIVGLILQHSETKWIRQVDTNPILL